jgi:tetratricopeptide (TPR) repeat protein
MGKVNNLICKAISTECRGKLAVAERHYRCALALVPGQNAGVERLQIWAGLGNLCRLLGRYDEAEQYFRQALPLAESLHGRDAEETRSILNNWAVLHKYQGRFASGARL